MSQPAPNLSFRAAFADGQSLGFCPKAIRPYGLSEIRALARERNPSLTLECLADNPIVNGETVNGTGRLRGRITFTEPAKIFALVPNGGWFPVPFASPQHFLLDRNVVANFHKLRRRENFSDRASYEHWTGFFDQGTAFFNPLPYAFEGSAKRIPGFEEFVQAFERGVRELQTAFPNCRVVRYSASQYRMVYSVLLTIHTKTPREIAFLCEAAQIVLPYASDAKLRSLADRILALADRHNVDRQSLALLVVLSCIYANPKAPAADYIGRMILKPTQDFGPADAYNAVSDLRHIELAALGYAHIATDSGFALCTSDMGVASLWCALGIRDMTETAGETEFTVDYLPELFPRLTDLEEIAHMLAGRA